MGKVFLFIWRWVLPFVGALSLTFFAGIYIWVLYFHSINITMIEAQEPEKASPDVRMTSPDGTKDLVFSRYKKTNVDSTLSGELLGTDLPYTDGYVYIVDRGIPISWQDNISIADFNEKFVEGRNDERSIVGHWATDDRVILEYCGVDIGSFDNRPVGDVDGYLEVELHRIPECPEDLKIGDEPEVDWFDDRE